MTGFQGLLSSASDGEVVAPLLKAYLTDATWESSFDVRFQRGSTYRPPDGWFHPSQHPTWPERMLWWYLTQPERLIPERLAPENTISITMGTAVHSLIESALQDLGLILTTAELRELGYTVHGGEAEAIDPEVMSRGHMDGILRAHIPSHPSVEYHHFEFKTAGEVALRQVDSMDLDGFIAKWPTYYAQVQEYLRMTGFPLSVVVFMQMGFPWTMKEFHVPANRQYQVDVAGKYLRVIEASKTGVMPPPCCSVDSAQAKACPARGICPQAGGSL